MKHLKRVLCAVDIDERHRQVFAHALALARRSNASLLIVHAASPVRPLNEGATERVDFLRQLHGAAEATGVDVRVTVQRGDVADVILLHAAARHPDLIDFWLLARNRAASVGACSDGQVSSFVRRVVRSWPFPGHRTRAPRSQRDVARLRPEDRGRRSAGAVRAVAQRFQRLLIVQRFGQQPARL